MIKHMVWVVAILCFLIFISYFIFPGRYYFVRMNTSDNPGFMLRIDRWTGEAEYLDIQGKKWTMLDTKFAK